MSRRLVIAPHADDEVLGCGGLIHKYAADTRVLICATTSSERQAEHLDAMDILKVGSTERLHLPDGEVGRDPVALTTLLDQALLRYRPTHVYLPYPGSHQDHIAVYEAGMRACRQSISPGHYMPPNVLIYETPVYDLDTHDWPLRFNVFESLTYDQVEAKCQAMGSYDSQCKKEHSGSPEHLHSRARALGLARGIDYAEQFAAVRMVVP